jgi:hypothetical protein
MTFVAFFLFTVRSFVLNVFSSLQVFYRMLYGSAGCYLEVQLKHSRMLFTTKQRKETKIGTIVVEVIICDFCSNNKRFRQE